LAVRGWPSQQWENNLTQFIVHIGPHKTGTTYLQITLDTLRDVLAECGICVPKVWNAAPGLPSHMQLVWAIRNGDLTLVQDQVREILACRPRHVVISCEALSRLDLAQIGQLRRLLGAAPAQIVYYVRRWPERLPSLWQETVKFGHTDTLPEFLAKHLTGTDNSELRDASVIDRFSAVFGAPQVKVVCYSHLMERSLDIAAHFLASFLGLPDIALPGPGRPNQSLPILDTELIRTLNAIHVRRGGETSSAIREWFLAHKEGLVPDAILDVMRKCLNTIRLDETAKPFVLASQEIQARYASSLVPPWCVGTLHELRMIDVPYVRHDYLLEPTTAKILGDIHDMYLRTL